MPLLGQIREIAIREISSEIQSCIIVFNIPIYPIFYLLQTNKQKGNKKNMESYISYLLLYIMLQGSVHERIRSFSIRKWNHAEEQVERKPGKRSVLESRPKEGIRRSRTRHVHVVAILCPYKGVDNEDVDTRWYVGGRRFARRIDAA